MEYFGVSGDIPLDEYIENVGIACVGIGIPYSMYWHGDDDAHDEVVARVKSYLLVNYARQTEFEQQAWIMGQYMGLAIAESFAEKGKSVFPSKPVEFFHKGKTEEERQAEIKEEEAIKEQKQSDANMLAYLSNFM